MVTKTQKPKKPTQALLDKQQKELDKQREELERQLNQLKELQRKQEIAEDKKSKHRPITVSLAKYYYQWLESKAGTEDKKIATVAREMIYNLIDEQDREQEEADA
jgi:uncharacterized membrane-anchored protein YhcB (DUF1043 family)